MSSLDRRAAVAMAPTSSVAPLRGPWGVTTSLAFVVLAFAAEGPLRDLMAAAGLPVWGLRGYAVGGLPRALDTLVRWGSVLLVVVLAVRLTDVPLREYVAWRRPRLADVALAAGFVLTLYAGLVALTLLAGTADVHAGGTGRTPPGAGPVAILLAWWSTVLLAPFVEETVFRGFLWHGIARRHGAVAALAGTSVVFAAFHWGYWMPAGGVDLLSVAHYIVMGGVLGLFRLTSGSSIVPMVAHAMANGALAAFPVVVVALA